MEAGLPNSSKTTWQVSNAEYMQPYSTTQTVIAIISRRQLGRQI